MAISTVFGYSSTAASNTDVAGNGITGSSSLSLGNDAIQNIMAQIASGVVGRGSDIATAGTLSFDGASTPSMVHDLTGTTTVTAITLTAGQWRLARAQGAFTLTASATLVVNGSTSASYTTTAGDLLVVFGYSASTVRVWTITGGALAGVTTATASTVAARDSSANLLANNLLTNYATTATAAGTTTLTAASAGQQYFTGSSTQTVVLPVTSTLALGFPFRIVNNSTGAVTVQSSGANTIAVVGPGTACTFTCILTSGTSAASWDFKFGTKLTLGTPVASTSGTSIDFTGLPAGVKRVTCLFNGVSLSGTAVPIIQIGDSGGIETTGYLGAAANISGSAAAASFTTGFGTVNTGGGGVILVGIMVLQLADATNNIWVASWAAGRTDAATVHVGGGNKTLSPGPLDRIRFTSNNGTDTFDAGSVNITWE